MKFYTFKKVALKVKAPWQKLRFKAGKGYWLSGVRPKRKNPITMYDSVTVSEIPSTASAVAGYVNGRYKTFPKLVKDFPHAHKLSIAVSSAADAECLDVEQGDATNDVAAAWVKRQEARGVKRPVVYTSVSNAPSLLRVLDKAGVKRSDIRLWTAHYTFKSHLCNSKCWPGFTGKADATQWTDKALGRNLDASICSPGFFSV